MGYIITHHLLVGYAVEKKERPKKEKTKKRHRPDFTRWDANRDGKNAHFFFSIVCRRKGNEGGYPVKRRCASRTL